MWTKTRSLFLSRVLTLTMVVMFVGLCFFVPAIANWYADITVGNGLISTNIVLPMCVCMYIAAAFAFTALIALYKMLSNISKDEVFTQSNAKCLRLISWACMFAGIAFGVFGLWRFVFFAPTFFAVMFGLVMRVLKNVFEKAVEIKSENDFTV